ncbi:MAG: hypothetical protein ACP5NS_00200 [Candidatus Pacearchaeota archaeon]
MVWPNNYNWHTLDCYVTDLQEKGYPHRDFWLEVTMRPMNSATIRYLEKDGWFVLNPKMSRRVGERRDFYGTCDSNRKKIEIVRDLTAWDRDTTLMHELWHAYADEMERGILEDTSRDKKGKRNNAIVEWLARKSRTEPQLLATALKFAKLTPHVYDKSSYEAGRVILERPSMRFFGDSRELENDQMESYED